MPHIFPRRAAFCLVFCLFPLLAGAQIIRPDDYAGYLNARTLLGHAAAFSDSALCGRETGSPGQVLATKFLTQYFYRYRVGILASAPGYIQSFPVEGRVGRNVVGLIPGTSLKDEYVVVSAHYDHLGVLNGVLYPGADDNASGVAVLLNMVETFSAMRRHGKGPRRNILFVFYDAKEFSLAGSQWFAAHLPIPARKIIGNINIDQIGTTLAPPARNTDYVLAVGAGKLSRDFPMVIAANNQVHRTGLEIDFTFYGSESFSDVFYQVGDQYPLARKGVPSVLFTAGMNAYSYKPGDKAEILNGPVLEKRARLLFFLTWDLANRVSWLKSR